jgi:hypothetical protein
MSVTLTQKPDDHELQHHRTAAEIAADEVFENRDICDECFAIVRIDDVRCQQGIQAVDVEEKDAYGVTERPQTRTTCRDCGSIGCSTTGETASTRTALERVGKLADRLQAAGHSPDRQAMRYIVRQGKRRPELAGRDHDLYALAAKVGLKQGSIQR